MITRENPWTQKYLGSRNRKYSLHKAGKQKVFQVLEISYCKLTLFN